MTNSFNSENGETSDNLDLPENRRYPLPDFTYLNEISAGDKTFIKEIITYFLESGPEMIKTMKESSVSGDHEKLRFTAHKLLPQLTFVGILSAIPDVERIEKGAKLGDDVSALIDRTINIINCGMDDLKKMV